MRSIAVVHEVLSREPGEEVVFDEIVRSLVLLVEDTVLALHPVEIVVNGELGVLSTDLATPLAVALAELLTNAVEHAFIGFGGQNNDQVGVVTLNLYARRRRRRRRDPRQRARARRGVLASRCRPAWACPSCATSSARSCTGRSR